MTLNETVFFGMSHKYDRPRWVVLVYKRSSENACGAWMQMVLDRGTQPTRDRLSRSRRVSVE